MLKRTSKNEKEQKIKLRGGGSSLCLHERIKRRSFIFKRKYFFTEKMKILKTVLKKLRSSHPDGFSSVQPLFPRMLIATEHRDVRGMDVSPGRFKCPPPPPTPPVLRSRLRPTIVRVETRRNVTSSYKRIYTALLYISTFTKVYFRRNCSLKRDDAVLKAWRVCTVDDVASMANYAKFWFRV